jgi:hypothetical protein
MLLLALHEAHVDRFLVPVNLKPDQQNLRNQLLLFQLLFVIVDVADTG